MWKLTIEDDEGQRTTLELAQREYTIGRGEDCAIRLTERNVSRQHAALRPDASGWMLVDGGSYNGTFVNSERVGEPYRLTGTEIIQLGDYRLELLDDVTATAVAAEPVRETRPDRIVVVIGPTPGVEFVLQGPRMSLGRAEECSIPINHASVSRLHAELVALGESKWEVVDKGSSNGIRINGVDLRQGILEPGDALELGDVRLRYVGAGKYFRRAFDLNAQLPAAMAGVSAGSSFPKIAVAIGGIIALTLAGVLMFSAGDAGSKTEGSARTAVADVEARALLQQAKKHAADKDLDTAHEVLKGIPEDSAITEDKDYRDIEDAWADQQIGRAKEAEAKDDKDKMKTLLFEVADTNSVSVAKRREALDLAKQAGIDVSGKAVPVETPRPGASTRPPGDVPPPPDVPPPSTTPPVTPTTTALTPPPPVDPEKFNEQRVIDGLLARVRSGSASAEEAATLRAACSNARNTACRNEAHAYYMKKKNEMAPP